MMQLSAKLNDLRNKHGLTYQQLSDASGVPVGTLKSILSGTTAGPSFETVCAILCAMEESVDEFLGRAAVTAPADSSSVEVQQCAAIEHHYHHFSFMPLSEDAQKLTRSAISNVYSSEAYRIVHSNLKWWRAIALVLIALVVGWFTWDITHPEVGLIQYASSVIQQDGGRFGAIIGNCTIV